MAIVPLSFSRKFRLDKKSEFNAVFNGCKAYRRGTSTALVSKNTLSHPRLGVIVSKRKVNKSYRRNHIKRQVREMFRLKQQTLPNVDMIVIASSQAMKVDNVRFRKDLQSILDSLE